MPTVCKQNLFLNYLLILLSKICKKKLKGNLFILSTENKWFEIIYPVYINICRYLRDCKIQNNFTAYFRRLKQSITYWDTTSVTQTKFLSLNKMKRKTLSSNRRHACCKLHAGTPDSTRANIIPFDIHLTWKDLFRTGNNTAGNLLRVRMTHDVPIVSPRAIDANIYQISAHRRVHNLFRWNV